MFGVIIHHITSAEINFLLHVFIIYMPCKCKVEDKLFFSANNRITLGFYDLDRMYFPMFLCQRENWRQKVLKLVQYLIYCHQIAASPHSGIHTTNSER